jgi:hypothetical protein
MAFSAVPIAQQWELHRYYQTIVDAPEDVLLANRDALAQAEPSLPHRAGKTYALVVHAAAYYEARIAAPVPATSKGRKERVITVRAVARPEPDLKKLAWAFLRLAEEQRKRQRDQESEAA